MTSAAILFESLLLMSMAALCGLVFEFLWCIDFLTSVFYPDWAPHVAAYMFNPLLPLWLKALSLFHLVLPLYFILFFMKHRYIKTALPLQIALSGIVLIVSRLVSDPSQNVNLVNLYLYLNLSPIPYFIFQAVTMVLILFGTHKFLLRLSN